MITQAPRGVEDWYGERMHKRAWVEKQARELARTYNMTEIITPIFEHTVLFQRGVGETTDVVQKEMYTFEDKGGRSITLKPEGTAGAMRAYLERNMYANPAPTKLYYVTQAFRYEKPQSGRLRQHHQFGVEFVGSKSPLAEVEVISLAATLIKKLGLKDVKLHINSIGCPNCKKDYNDALLAYLRKHEDALCPTCRERMQKNPMRVIDCKVPECKEIVKDAPRTIDYLDEECKNHFDELQHLLAELGIPFEVDTGIVRGLDYYTKTVFELITKTENGNLTVCGGGRYDNLVEQLGGPSLHAVGFGMGIERVLMLLDSEGVVIPKPTLYDVFVTYMGAHQVEAFSLVQKLRDAGFKADMDHTGRSLKAQFKYANKMGATLTATLGDEEIASGVVKVKNMATKEEQIIALDNIADGIRNMLASSN